MNRSAAVLPVEYPHSVDAVSPYAKLAKSLVYYLAVIGGVWDEIQRVRRDSKHQRAEQPVALILQIILDILGVAWRETPISLPDHVVLHALGEQAIQRSEVEREVVHVSTALMKAVSRRLQAVLIRRWTYRQCHFVLHN